MLSPTGLLLCEENPSSLGTEDEEVLPDGYDEEYIKVLLDREIASGGLQPPDLLQKTWVPSARLGGINYILTVCFLFFFSNLFDVVSDQGKI